MRGRRRGSTLAGNVRGLLSEAQSLQAWPAGGTAQGDPQGGRA